ncbi:MAG: phage portal protein [Pseudolabrys sp.]|nr:phage portal protein [Pseudolabrys sp.]
MGLLSRLMGTTKAAEGQARPGPYLLDGGWLSAAAGKFMNWWQMGYSLRPGGESGAMVEACVSAYAQTVAMCPGDHKRALGDGGVERVTTSDLSRVIRKPNDYQSMSDFLLNLTRRVYTKGEGFALAVRNSRNEIAELHWMRDGWPIVAEDGSIFYWLRGNEIVERRFNLSDPIPARDVLHVRLHTPQHPLKGESPITACALELQMSGAALTQQVAFYLNQARPSFMLETEQKLSKTEADDLRQRWDSQTQGGNAGGTPILSWGLKAKAVTVGAGDAQLAEMMKLSDQNVALAFRVPLQILGIGGTPFASTEALMSSWKAMGLGFVLNHIEEAFGALFRLKGFPEEYVEFDTNALLRSSFKEMIDALSTATRRLMTLDEARRFIDLPKIAGGDEILIQDQDKPLSMAGKSQASATTPNPANTDDEPDPDNDTEAEAERNERMRQSFRSKQAAHVRIAA